MEQLLEIKHLSKSYKTSSLAQGEVKTLALDDLNLKVYAGEILAVIGESGSGKSTLAKMITGLEKPSGGELCFAKERGHAASQLNVQMVFQDPYACLNPVFPVSQPVTRALQVKQGLNKKAAQQRALEIFESVGLTPAEAMMQRFPHELSGGQRQRVAIARAVATDPELLIADEPTSMLDVSIRIDILNLLRDLRDKQKIGIILITHDVASAWYLADRIAVLYRGQLVEMGDADQIALAPQHPYTKVLIAASQNRRKLTESLTPAKTGADQAALNAVDLCKFLPRCGQAGEVCLRVTPKLDRGEGNRLVRCLLADKAAKQNESLLH